jgi:hypothetical protein
MSEAQAEALDAVHFIAQNLQLVRLYPLSLSPLTPLAYPLLRPPPSPPPFFPVT